MSVTKVTEPKRPIHNLIPVECKESGQSACPQQNRWETCWRMPVKEYEREGKRNNEKLRQAVIRHGFSESLGFSLSVIRVWCSSQWVGRVWNVSKCNACSIRCYDYHVTCTQMYEEKHWMLNSDAKFVIMY